MDILLALIMAREPFSKAILAPAMSTVPVITGTPEA